MSRRETTFTRVGEIQPRPTDIDIIEEDLDLLPVACYGCRRPFFQESIEIGIKNAVVTTEEDVDNLLIKVLKEQNRDRICCSTRLMGDPLVVRLINKKYQEVKIKTKLKEGLTVEETNTTQTLESMFPVWSTKKSQVVNLLPESLTRDDERVVDRPVFEKDDDEEMSEEEKTLAQFEEMKLLEEMEEDENLMLSEDPDDYYSD